MNISNEDYIDLMRLVTEISWRIDHDQADTIWELFTPDGSLNTSGTPLIGHEAIREWGENRVKANTKSRHVVTSTRFTATAPDKATGSALLVIFMEEKDQVGSSIPKAVGEDRDEFVRTADGWKFVSRVFEMHFSETGAA